MSFSENFWSAELCDFTGFDTIWHKLQNGRKSCKEYADYLKIIAQAQEVHGKTLIKLSKLSFGKDEIGTLRQSWEIFRLHTESVGLLHMKTANEIYEEMRKVLEFSLDQKKVMKLEEENVRKMQSKLKSALKRVQEAKKVYYSKCREAEIQHDKVTDVVEKSGLAMKELEKKVTHSKQLAEQAEAVYIGSLEMLNEVKQNWESTTENSLKVFQTLEEERIKFLRNFLWLVLNFSSQRCVDEDSLNENVRVILEKCDPKHDIDVFVHLQQTGITRPEVPEYEPYKSNCQGCASSISDPELSPSKSSDHSAFHSTSGKIKKFFSLESIGQNNRKNSMKYADNDLYETIEVDMSSDMYKVLYQYAARHDDELTLVPDEIVKVLSQENDDWWQVETQDNKRGLYPATYLIALEND